MSIKGSTLQMVLRGLRLKLLLNGFKQGAVQGGIAIVVF